MYFKVSQGKVIRLDNFTLILVSIFSMREVTNNIRNWKEIVARCRRMKCTCHSSYCTRLSLDMIIIFN